jgi:hypothetical protein
MEEISSAVAAQGSTTSALAAIVSAPCTAEGSKETDESMTNKSTHKPRTKDPRGGLTAAGRREFFRKEGAHLKPGVKKSVSDMTPEEMKRKGSWAVRFYGRSGGLPPLKDKNGKPTRFALTAAAWGEPVPKTVAAARKIAAKGHQLLARAKRAK